ncbi:hypothetical protein FHN55_19985 [Streptomyces sp. NP160]|uniref:hypothetical protein n=1 Tax=Streptomyces sp. NP160 TaxID=2586637 RepID=UPI0011199707|nr:hypothetical protein [Streptomyces sp. NP160]TNM59785.1 hypothetical protein FHN55_19985 [Streptomyces sp. NP160]
MERSRRLDDDALAEEIELYGDLVVAASEAGDVLPQAEIDRLLGVAASGDPEDGDEPAGGASDQVSEAPQDASGRGSAAQAHGA